MTELVDDVIALDSTAHVAWGCATAELVQYEHYNPNAYRTVKTVMCGGDDSLTDIFYPYAPGASAGVALKSEDWDVLIAALGGDPDITSICVITAAVGGEITAQGGILLDGYVCEVGETSATVKCVAYQYQGASCYLLGFSDYAAFY